MPEHGIDVPLWNESGHTDGSDLSISPELRERLVEIQRLWEATLNEDGLPERPSLWGDYAWLGRAAQIGLQRELGVEFDVNLWLPSFVRDRL
jgi:hypothetical protein